MNEDRDLCVKAARGPIVEGSSAAMLADGIVQEREEERTMLARVGKSAPDFEAGALVDGGFKNVKLSDYRGKWVVLCFYPGDFTFV